MKKLLYYCLTAFLLIAQALHAQTLRQFSGRVNISTIDFISTTDYTIKGSFSDQSGLFTAANAAVGDRVIDSRGNSFEVIEVSASASNITAKVKVLNGIAPAFGIATLYRPTQTGMPLLTNETPDMVLVNTLNSATLTIDSKIPKYLEGSVLPTSDFITGAIVKLTSDSKLYTLTGTGWSQVAEGGIATSYAANAAAIPPGNKGDMIKLFFESYKIYVFDGSQWTAPVEISSLPVPSKYGDIFFVTGENKLYMYDANDNWISLGGSRPGGTLPSPGDSKPGDTFYHTIDNVLYVFDGTQWLPLGNSLEEGKIYIGDSNGIARGVDLASIKLSQFGSPDTSLDLAGKALINIGEPISDQDAVTKFYVDNRFANPEPVALSDAHVFVGDGTGVARPVYLNGDILLDNTGLVTIQPNAVDSTMIQDGSITASKIAPNSIDGSKLLDGSIDSTKVMDGSIGGSKLADNSIPGSKIQDGAIIGAKIAPNSIDGSKLLDGSIDSTKVMDGSIGGGKLADNSIAGSKIQDGAIVGAKIAANSIDGSKLLDGSIDSTKVMDGSIGLSKLTAGGIQDANKVFVTDSAGTPTLVDRSTFATSTGAADTFADDFVVNGVPNYLKWTNGQTVPAKGKTAIQLLLEGSQMAVPPGYSAPTATLSSSPTAGDVEVGRDLGTISLNGVFTQRDAGTLISTQYSKNDVPIPGNTDVIGNLTGQVKYTVTFSYAEGAVKNNNMGVPDPTGRITAGSISRSVTFNPVSARFYGFVSSSNPADSEVRTLSKDQTASKSLKTIIPNPSSAKYLCFRYPVSAGAITSIKVNGFAAFGAFTITQSAFTNENGYTSNYYLIIGNNPVDNSGASSTDIEIN